MGCHEGDRAVRAGEDVKLMDPIDGHVTITCIRSTHHADRVTITIRFGDQDIEASMSMEDFGYCATGQARMPAKVRAWDAPGVRRG